MGKKFNFLDLRKEKRRLTKQEIMGLFLNEEKNLNLLGIVVGTILLVVAIQLLIRIFDGVVEQAIYRREREKKSSNGRILTLTNIASSLVRYGLYIVGALIFLNFLDINTSTLLATAGVGTFALALGAQTLVKDFITGLFILFEDQYSVGDFVECATKTGYVQDVGVRVTKLRDVDGSLHIIPNSEIRVVTNQSRGKMRAKVIVSVDGLENPKRVLEIFEKAMEPLRNLDRPSYGPSLWGVTNNSEKGYQITIVGWSEAGDQYGLEFQIRQAIIEAMIEENIAQPRWRFIEGVMDDESVVL